MTPESYAVIADALAEIAPDVDATRVDDDLHDDLGLDSMDLLNLAAAVSDATGVDIPDRDYGRLTTIAKLATYVERGTAR
jgi:acyl carrier protein